MKFLCEHCKAKYQIADEKVAGRTVRMKCRKCGGAIEIRAAVTETSVAMKASDVSGSDAPSASPTRAPAPRPSPLATSLSQAARPAPPPRPPPRDGHLAGAFQRNVQREEDAAAGTGLDLRELSTADEWYVAVNGVPVGPVRVGEVRRKAAQGAVNEESLCWQEGMDEWRPIKTVTELAAVVREAASGGRGSQLPPEPKPSGPPAPARPTVPRAAPAPPRAGGGAGARLESLDEDGVETLIGRSPLLDLEAAGVPAVGRSVPGPSATPAPHAVRSTAGAFPSASSDPFKSVDPFKPKDPLFGAGAAVPEDAAAPFAVGPAATEAAPAPLAATFSPAPQPAPTTFSTVAQPPIVVPQPASAKFSPIAVGVIVMFACFGLMGGYVFFFKPDKPPVVAAAAPVSPTVAPTTAPAVTAAPEVPAPTTATSAPTPSIDSGPKVASSGNRPSGNAASGSAGAKQPAGAVTDPSLRDLIASTGGGPATGPGGGGGASGGGGAQLTEDEIKSVVGQHNLALRRTCWERNTATAPSVNVTVHIEVAGSGQVTQATATGNDAVVGHCLEEEIKRWRWPGGGSVNVPFHFLRQ